MDDLNPPCEDAMDIHSVKLLMLAVVQEQDRDTATHALERLSLPVVYLFSSGGFLGRRNATLLIGLREGHEEEAIQTLEESCRQRVEYLTLPLEGCRVSRHSESGRFGCSIPACSSSCRGAVRLYED